MRLVTILVILFLITPGFAAITENTVTIQGSASVMRHVVTEWGSEVNGEYNEGGSKSRMLTAPGDIRYQTTDVLDGTVNNRYTQTGYVEVNDGMIFEDTVSMGDSTPGQSVAISHSGILESAVIDTAKFVNDANVSMGQRADISGTGMYFRDVDTAVALFENTDEVYGYIADQYSYTTTTSDRLAVFTNETDSIIVRPEFRFDDFVDNHISKIREDSKNLTTNMTGNLS